MLLEPETLGNIAAFVSGGGSLAQWVIQRDVTFHNVHGWIHADKERLSVYTRALEARSARLSDKVLDRMNVLLDADPRKAYRKGKLLSVDRLPDSVAGAVTEVQTGGRGGDKLKLVAPDKGVELMGRHLGMFREKLDVTVNEGLAGRLAAARSRSKAKVRAG